MAPGIEQTYRYARPSTARATNGVTDVLLCTSGGTTASGAAEHPRFFDGYLHHGAQTATSLLAVAKVARA